MPGFGAPAETLIHFAGRVVDNNAVGLAGALVDIVDLGLSSTTNDSGQFDFRIVNAGTHSVRAAATGFKIAIQPVTVPNLPGEFVIQLAPL
jgi:protocatechuate 3,4-dioxygenase beta subunit